MTGKLEKTRHPGIYRRGSRYAVMYRDADGKQRWESARTLDEARTLKARRTMQRDTGDLQEASRITLHDYLREWVERYQGGSRGFREETREEYRADLERYALRFFSARLKLPELTPRHVAQFVGWLCD